MEIPRRSLELGSPVAPRCLLFAPGFLLSAESYAGLLSPVASSVGRIIVVAPEAPAVALLAGRHPPAEQADRLAEIARSLQDDDVEVALGGHSRGGFVAWLAARLVAPWRVVLVDPVSGGRGPWSAPEPLPPFDVGCPSLVIGCGSQGRCAPAGRNHEVFAAQIPGCRHTVVPECGHADVLVGPAARLGRLLCGRGRDQREGREAVSRAMVELLT